MSATPTAPLVDRMRHLPHSRAVRTNALWRAAVVLSLLVPHTGVSAQAEAPATGTSVPRSRLAVRTTGSLRSRVEDWRWFDTTTAGAYRYSALLARVGVDASHGSWSARTDLSVPVLLSLPTSASAPAPLGQFGLGANYASASTSGTALRSNVAGFFVRQAVLQWKQRTTTALLGRFDASDGVERTPSTPALATLKNTRLSQRLLGPFGFTHGQRAMDGISVQTTRARHTFTGLAIRPTSGVFAVTRAGRSLPVNIAYGAWSYGRVRTHSEWDARLFALWYQDERGLVPTDSRSASVRTSAPRDITVNTVGGHLVGIRSVGAWSVDGLAWGAAQTGTWSTLRHRAYALALEVGAQRRATPWSPWVRAGWYRGSGDRNSADDRHGTFFQIAPTPRPYARFPFYNGMNSDQVFVYATVKPSRTVGARLGLHDIRLASTSDQWLLGGGAFDTRTFGYIGRSLPTGSAARLGIVSEASVEWKPTAHVAVEGFLALVGHAAGPARIYGTGSRGHLALIEFTLTK